jgi:hypothetical protein
MDLGSGVGVRGLGRRGVLVDHARGANVRGHLAQSDCAWLIQVIAWLRLMNSSTLYIYILKCVIKEINILFFKCV